MTIGYPKPPKKEKKQRKLMKRGGRIRPNRKRKERAFQEDFGGKEYLALIRSLPCAVCGIEGFTVSAHLTSRGAGGKADVTAPLCCTRVLTTYDGTYVGAELGCHERYDAHDPEIRKHEPRLRREAKKRWTEFQSTLSENAA